MGAGYAGSEHFQIEQLTAGVYAVIARSGGAAHSNAGIVDLGDRTLVFDTLGTPTAAVALRAAAEGLTGRSPSYAINSHIDHDHWLGNQVFAADVTIISTHETRRRMTTAGTEYVRRCRDHPEILEEQIREAEARLETETDERWRVSLAERASSLRNELQALLTVTLCYPTQTFETKMVFHGSGRMVELLTWGGGHSPSDAFLLLPKEKIAFVGDLGFFQFHLPLMSGDVQTLTAILERLAALDLKTYVPGHGPVGTGADVRLQLRYIATLEALVAQVAAAGGSADDAARLPVPAPFDAWSYGMGLWEANIRFLYQRLSESSL